MKTEEERTQLIDGIRVLALAAGQFFEATIAVVGMLPLEATADPAAPPPPGPRQPSLFQEEGPPPPAAAPKPNGARARVPRDTGTVDPAQVENFIAARGDNGAAVGEICTGLRITTAQARLLLKKLQEAKLIDARGDKRARRYHAVSSDKPADDKPRKRARRAAVQPAPSAVQTMLKPTLGYRADQVAKQLGIPVEDATRELQALLERGEATIERDAEDRAFYYAPDAD